MASLASLPSALIRCVSGFLCLAQAARVAILDTSWAQAAAHRMKLPAGPQLVVPTWWNLADAIAALSIWEPAKHTLRLQSGAYLLPEVALSADTCILETGAARRRALDVVAVIGDGRPLTIIGSGIGVTVLEGNLRIRRGSRVALASMSVVNPCGSGILVSAGGKLDASEIEVTDCARRGVAVIGAFQTPPTLARFHQCTISKCQGAGFFASQSHVFIDDCTIIDNDMTGIIARAKAWVQIRGPKTVVQDNPNALSSTDGAEIELIFDAQDADKRSRIADANRENRSGWGRCFSKCDGPGIRRWTPPFRLSQQDGADEEEGRSDDAE
jgi:hypothetical protein